jgi:hypothetical protein
MVGFPSYQRSPNRLGLRRATSILSRQLGIFQKDWPPILRSTANWCTGPELNWQLRFCRPTVSQLAYRRVGPGESATHASLPLTPAYKVTIPSSISILHVEKQSSFVVHLGTKSRDCQVYRPDSKPKRSLVGGVLAASPLLP